MGFNSGFKGLNTWNWYMRDEWEDFTCHENDDVVSATTTGFLPG